MLALGEDKGGLTKKELDNDVARNPFSDWLPWIAFDDANDRYLNIDNTYGYAWECLPHAFTTQRELKVLEGIISQPFPDDAVLQFILYADENIEEFLAGYKRTKIRQDELVKKSIEEISEFYRKGTKGLGQLNGIPLRNFRCFFTVKTESGLQKDFLSNLEDSLKGARLAPRRLGPKELLRWMRTLINGDTNAPGYYDENVPIRKQVIKAESPVTWNKDNEQVTRIGSRFARCITPKLLPDSCDIMQVNRLCGAIMGVEEDGDQVNAPFLWTVNILPANVKADIHTKASIMMAQKSFGSFAAKLQKRVEELGWAMQALEREKFVKIIPTLWVFGDTEEKARDAMSRAKRIWETHSYYMQEEAKIARPLFIASLPFGLYNIGKNLTFLERDFAVPLSVAVRMIPIQADYRGTPSAVLTFVGRKGQVIGFDVFEKNGVNNHNFLITAGSGAGKSFTLNYLCANYYASGALVRLIDIGYSYKKLCSTAKGRYLDFGKEAVCINPFHSTGKDAEDRESDLQATADVVSEMVYSASGQSMTETEWTLVKDAVRFAANRDGGEYGIDHVYEYLSKYPHFVEDKEKVVKEITTAAKIMAFNLRDYKSDGRYGRFFNGKSTFNISEDQFVVLELEKLKSQQELFRVVTLQVANACTQDLYLTEDRSTRRFILFEEAYQFLKMNGSNANSGNERIGRIIEEGYRRARKYGGSFGIVTQSLNDLKSFGSSGPVIKTNSAFKILLEADDYEEAARNGVANYDGLALDILKTVKNNKPKYSEIFFDTPLGMGVGRLVVDPWTYWLNTSAAEEVAQYENLLKKGVSPLNALKELSGR